MYIYVVIEIIFVNWYVCIEEKKFGYFDEFLWYLVGFLNKV